MGDMELREKFGIRATFDAAVGRFEILGMTAGVGNGWNFGAEVLKESVPLWDRVESFVDHGSFFESGRSLRDLGGVCFDPVWSEADQGIKLSLRTVGPSGPLLDALGREMVSGIPLGEQPHVGFSADIGFTATGREVKQILRVFALDVVFDPARGGAFLRALNSVGAGGAGGGEMNKCKLCGVEVVVGADHTCDPVAVAAFAKASAQATVGGVAKKATDGVVAQLSADLRAIQDLVGVQEERAALAAEAEKANALRGQMCAYLLDTGLLASKLPKPAMDRVRTQFAGKVFEPAELTAAIDDARRLVAELTGGAGVMGLGAARHMFSSADQLQAAVDDLLGAPREVGAEALHVARLSGIRELYHGMTGDYDYHGGFYAERARFATTADFTGLVKNALNKIVVNQWDKLGRAGYDWWMRVSTQEHFESLNAITGTLIGTVGTLPVVAERGEYTELNVGDSPETASFVKYGGYIPLTLELIDRDETRKLKAYPRELANAGLRRISGLVAAVFTDNTAVGPTMADTGALFNATAVTTAGGHKNLLTTALAAAEWEVVSTAVYNQPMLIKNAAGIYGTGPKQAVNPKFCLVPRALQLTAMKILYPALENLANIYSDNLQRGQPGDVVTVPEWTDADDWAAVCDPDIAPAIYVGERFGMVPEIFIAGDELSPAVFMNDEHRLKVRHFCAVWVNDFRPLHKSNV